MAGHGETVKYYIDADTSGFTRGLADAVLESEIAGKAIKKNLSQTAKDTERNFSKTDKSVDSTTKRVRNFGTVVNGIDTKTSVTKTTALNGAVGDLSRSYRTASSTIGSDFKKTSKSTENNFKDIRRNAQISASSIRNFGVAFQGFDMTSMIIGVTALSGAALELAGALSAAGSTLSVIAPILAQGVAATAAMKAGLFGLSAAFKAIGQNDPKAFRDAMTKLGPAAKEVALGVAGLNKAFNSIRLNTQQALLQGVGKELLRLGAIILPTVNAGFQTIGKAMNGAFSQAASLASQPVFSGLLATIFADTAHNITVLSGALAPLLTIFTNLYLVTRPYVTLLAQQIVNLLKNGAAFLSTVRGQAALNLAIQQGIIALKQLAGFVGAAFGLLTSIFRTSVNEGNNLIVTLTGILKAAEGWVNSAKGQAQLTALFRFTGLAIQGVADALGRALGFFFSVVQAVDSLNPALQQLIIEFLTSALTLHPLISYFTLLYQAVKTLGLVIFNLAQQAVVVFAALGAVSSIVVILAVGLIALGAIIKGPLGSAFIIIGSLMAIYIGLNFLLAKVAAAGAVSFWEQAFAAFAAAGAEADLAATQGVLAITMLEVAAAGGAAGAGLGFAATAARVLQASLIPLLVLAAGVLIILSMLGVFSGKAKQAQAPSIGLGNSLGALQQSMKGVGSTGPKAANSLAPLADSLNNVGDAAAGAQGQLASFDKMNVLSPTVGGPGTGIPNVPSLPDVGGLGGGAMGAPTLDTGAFDSALADMQKNFDGLKTDLGQGLFNPFDAIGKWINSHPWIALAGFIAILAAVAVAFIVLDVAALPISLTIGLIVLAVVAIIAIIILLVQNWSTVWATISGIVSSFATFVGGVFKGIFDFIGGILKGIGDFFTGVFNAIVDFIKTWGITILAVMFLPFSLLLGLVLTFKDQIGAFFVAIWNGIVAVFTPIGAFFGKVFTLAWEAIKLAFGLYVGFFTGLWTGLVAIFTPVVNFFAGIFNGAWNAIKAAFGAVGGFFQGVWNSIVSIFGAVGTAIGNAIGGAFKSVVNTVINTVANIINNVINLINGAIGLINKIPGVHIGTVGAITLPRLAKGGIINSPTTAVIGEAGAEAVMPLENNTAWITQLADKINAANGSGNGQPINLTVQIGEDKVATKIIDLINEKTQMSGRNTILI